MQFANQDLARAQRNLFGMLEIEGPVITLMVTGTDASDNQATAELFPVPLHTAWIPTTPSFVRSRPEELFVVNEIGLRTGPEILIGPLWERAAHNLRSQPPILGWGTVSFVQAAHFPLSRSSVPRSSKRHSHHIPFDEHPRG